MPRVIATHAVGNMDTWLAGGKERAVLFKQFCSSYRIYRQPQGNNVAICWENADMQKFEATLSQPEAQKAKARHTVIDPIEIYIEVEGAS